MLFVALGGCSRMLVVELYKVYSLQSLKTLFLSLLTQNLLYIFEERPEFAFDRSRWRHSPHFLIFSLRNQMF